jgi:phage baseplate assembly protein gpV
MGKIQGVVTGQVVSVKDPDKQGRVQVRFPYMGGQNESYWAPVATLMSGGGRGAWFMPEVGDEVLVAFNQDQVGHPYILGYLWNGLDKPPDGDPNNRVIKTPGGHTLRFEDTAGSTKVILMSNSGQTITLDDSDSSICPHGGKGTTTPLHPRWQVNGGFVAVENDPGTLLCPFIPVPCVGYQLKSMGLNATEIEGQRVILVTDFNQTFTGLPLVMADFHQTFDNSTPAPLPAGQPAPPPSPEMADFIGPVVTQAVVGVPFVIATSKTPVVVTFTLMSNHPLQWILTLINEPLKQHVDMTNGLPGAVVSPAGGNWDTPSLTITVTMTPVFVAALTAGQHHLYLTGVSKRGMSGFAEAKIKVT